MTDSTQEARERAESVGCLHTRGAGMRPRLLDLFCGAGGCSVGYHRAGFDVVGVDLHPQPNYPFAFHQFDALHCLEWLCADGSLFGIEFDAIHASPPCQAYIRSGNVTKDGRHPDLLGLTRELLNAAGTEALVDVLRDMVQSGQTETVLLASHVPALRDAFDRCIVVTREDGRSQAVVA